MFCKLCGSGKIKIKYHIKQFKPSFDIYECGDCGFQYQEMSEKTAYQFYQEDYYKGKAAYSYLDERQMEEASRIVWKKRMKILKQWDSTIGIKRNFLDIGCSFGGFMQTAEEAGFNAYGVEVSKYSGDFVRKRFGKDRVYIGSCEKVKLPENFFSIVTMIEVVEHLLDPEKAVRNIFQSLKKGGVFLVQTADMAGLQAVLAKDRYHYYLPGHLSYFTRENLTLLLRKSGFREIRFFGGVEFGLLPKLLKSAHSFQKWTDYLKWARISLYHILSKIAVGRLHLTSSMVIAAWK
jgi:2-polyprenyl-3-methyl-5-hydroxy-6-metoxy-1,4-benzoquinol methylase